MDSVGLASNVAGLIQQTFNLYRHVSAARNFADTAGSYAAMISFQYFRFELWIQQSGLLTTDAAGDPSISETAIRTCLQRAWNLQNGLLEIHHLESNVLASLGQLQLVLKDLNALKEKYKIDSENTIASPSIDNATAAANPINVSGQATASDLLLRGGSVAKAAQTASKSRQRLSTRVSFFKKVGFGWALTDDTSDKDKLAGLIDKLQFWNNALRELLPLNEVKFGDTVVNVRTLALSNEADGLENIGRAARKLDGLLYQDINAACSIRAQRLRSSTANVSGSAPALAQLVAERVEKIEKLSQLSASPGRHLTKYLSGMNVPSPCLLLADRRPEQVQLSDRRLERARFSEHGTAILIEFTTFDNSLKPEECLTLQSRMSELCQLLANSVQPSSMLLPLLCGYLQYRQTQFALAYYLPSFATQHRNAFSLYSIIRSNKRSELKLKSLQLWPTLEQRYKLASILAEGLLSLLNVGWVHKALNSANIVLFHEQDSVHPVEFSKPQMMGFGVARPDRSGEFTIDVRGLDSPWSLWQHPELRQSLHRRYERRYDIYSFGMILFEIGMWQDLHYFSGPDDSPFEFRQRVVNICHAQLAHNMGELYREVVLICIDSDHLFLSAESPEDMSSPTLEMFSWEVVRPLRQLGAQSM